MDFSAVREQVEQKFSGEPASDQAPESTPDTPQGDPTQSQDYQVNQPPQEAKEQAQALLDLSKAEKFVIDGREYTLDQLKKEMMFQQDYTRKTQSFAEEKKAYEAQRKTAELENSFQADLETVRRNPSRFSELAKHYPREMIDKARALIQQDMSKSQQPDPKVGAALARDEIESIIESRFKSHEEKIENQRLVGELDNIFSEMKSKYPEMKDGRMERFVLAELQAQDASGQKIDKSVVEKTFKDLNDWMIGTREAHTKSVLTKQSEANKRGKDVGAGGGTPGQAPAKLKLGDVKGALMKHLQNQQT